MLGFATASQSTKYESLTNRDIFGLRYNRVMVPIKLNEEEKNIPGAERSSRYHNAGLAKARVTESCSVDCHGNLRYS